MGMQLLMQRVRGLMEGPVRELVEQRIRDFGALGKRSREERFSELAFCILTANFTAEGGARIQRELGREVLTLPEAELARRLKELGHRFPNARAHYIVEARKHLPLIDGLPADGRKAREKLLAIKGLGMKEASHFLRNTGYRDVAIVDRHILNLLNERGLVERGTLTPGKYMEIERLLEFMAKELGTDLARLDLYLWYLKTGKVLK